MPSNPRANKRALYVELDEELDAAFRALGEKIGYGPADNARLAIRRHVESPPTVVVTIPPLPPVVADPPPPKPRRGRPRRKA